MPRRLGAPLKGPHGVEALAAAARGHADLIEELLEWHLVKPAVALDESYFKI
jgi:hypothetical protein